MSKHDFIVQTIDAEINSDQVHELKDSLDKDYSFLIGIAISDIKASKNSILEQVKVKGIDLLPDNFEAIHVMSSNNVEPNKRFYCLFNSVEIKGDDIVVRFIDPDWAERYNLQVHLLLANNPEKLINGLLG